MNTIFTASVLYSYRSYHYESLEHSFEGLFGVRSYRDNKMRKMDILLRESRQT